MELRMENIAVTRSRKTILRIDNLSLAASGMVALIGPNGAGKSTMLKVLGGLESADSGTLHFRGRNLGQLSGGERAAMTGYIPQHFQPCWNQKVAELLNLAIERSGQADCTLATLAADFELADLLNRPWDSLSGGERGRVALSMALAGDPPLLLADEPGAAMDIGHNLNMLEHFRERSRRSLVMVCLHDLNLAFKYFDWIIFINRGEPAFSGLPDELLRGCLLEQSFGVDFFKIKTEAGWLVQPRSLQLS